MMGSSKKGICDDEYSVIGDKGEIGFIDFEDDISVTSFDPTEEGPVLVSVPFPFIQRKPQSVLVGETSKCSITIENTTDDPVELWGVRIFCSNPADTFTLSLREPPSADSPLEKRRGFLEGYSLEDRVLQPRQTLTIWLSCKPKDLGLHTSVVYFDVGDERVERVVFLLAEDQVSQSLVSRRPYLRTPRRKQFAIDEYVVSSRPARAKTERPKKRLLEYPIPKDVRELINNKQVPAVLTEGLTMENYASFFSVLLIMEELHLEEDTRAYNMEGITMKRKGAQLLALEVPGLAERRPSLVHGDHVFVKAASANSGDSKVYEGYIYSVEADEVLLRFAKVFHDCHESRNLYDVRFTYNRVNMRRLYQAIEETASLDTDLLFPSQLTQRRSIQTAPFVPFTTALNDEQRRSIEMILGCEGAPPYVIYGPPGTGKTKTLVEAILQVYMTRENSRVLVCAASNSAADHILEGLISNQAAEVKDNEVFRLNASSRSYQDVPAEYIRFCFFEDSIFTCPPCKALMHYRIIISTYMSSSLLYAEGIKMGHFSHIFLDEAGQASEPEIMVPISNFWERKSVVVLAGDPKQLGPVVYSKNAEAFGLGRSYLERLFECDHYRNEDEGFVTKLVRNYRCHPAILDLPSKLFYNGELLACKEDDSFISSNLDFLPNKEFPVLFFGIQGCDEREENNPSWFNRIEASKVVDLINKLRVSTEISEADIGVIAPYRQQVLKIKKVLETWDMLDVKVGSVEQFQGQEREVVIISTVRSTIKHNDFDRTFSLGFLSNPRRFNVAITRAKSLLIVVGNPHIVCKDPYWDKLLRHCSDNGSYQGCGLPEREEQADAVEAVAEWRDLTNLEGFPPSVTDETQWEEGWK